MKTQCRDRLDILAHFLYPDLREPRINGYVKAYGYNKKVNVPNWWQWSIHLHPSNSDKFSVMVVILMTSVLTMEERHLFKQWGTH